MEEKESKETIAEILAEYRADADKMDRGELYQPTTIYIRQLLNRIEAAWERETKAIATENAVLPAVCITKSVGNAAAMREAMTDLCNAALKVIVLRGHDAEDLRSLGFYMDKANLALSEPPRNCDVMDWRTAWMKWRTENHPQKPVGYSECYESTTMFMDWYMGMSEREGEGNGR